MATFNVALGERSHPVHVGPGLLDRLGQFAVDAGLARGRCAIVTDSSVAALYLERATRSLRSAGFDPAPIEVPPGENSKSLASLERVYDLLAEAGLDRAGTIFALGGGVVGDLAGYAAATYLRGVASVQVPTTVVAQVDSALGGKNGVNLRRAKNLVGTFYQPRLIVADVALLASLGDREFREGLAEVIKYGAIMDAPMIAELERSLDALLRRDLDRLEWMVDLSLRHKASVVSRDERESGLRAILNFGHTIGHALEASTSYGNFLHGEAVAIGMIAASALSRTHAGLSQQQSDRLALLIERAGLPTAMPGRWNGEDFTRALRLDKKRASTGVEFVLISELGHALTRKLGFDEILAPLG